MTGYTDLKAGANVTILDTHANVNRGRSFQAWAVDTVIGPAETLRIGFKTPLDREIHIVIKMTTSMDSHLIVYEDADWTSGTGTARNIYSRNRQVGHLTSQVMGDASGIFVANEIVENPTITVVGNEIDRQQLFVAFSAGAKDESLNKIILKKDTQYTIVGTSDLSQGNGAIFIYINFSEIPEKNYDKG